MTKETDNSNAAERTGKDSIDPRTEEKRLKFFNAAKPLFLRFGFRKTTVEEICREAGVSKRTFYELFADKGDLLMQLCLLVSDSMILHWREKVAGSDSALFGMDVFLDEYTRLSHEEKIFEILISEPAVFMNGISDDTKGQMKPLMGLLKGILEQGVRTGEFRKLDPERTTWIIFTLLDSVHFIMPRFGGIPGPLEDKSFAEEVKAFIISSVKAERTDK